jgi:hypothetical protein
VYFPGPPALHDKRITPTKGLSLFVNLKGAEARKTEAETTRDAYQLSGRSPNLFRARVENLVKRVPDNGVLTILLQHRCAGGPAGLS